MVMVSFVLAWRVFGIFDWATGYCGCGGRHHGWADCGHRADAAGIASNVPSLVQGEALKKRLGLVHNIDHHHS